MRARAEKNNYKNGTKFNGLSSQIAYDARWKGLLYTPQASDWKDVTISKEGLENYKKGGHQMKHPHQLAEMYYKGLLPTPTAQDNPHPTNKVDENGRRWTEGAKASHSMGLADMAFTGLLPTPRVSDIEGPPVRNVELKNGKFSRTNAQGVRWGVKLKDVVEGFLPTPRASEGYAGVAHLDEKGRRLSGASATLTDLAGHGLLPTPLAGDWHDMAITPNNASKGTQDNLPRLVSRAVTGVGKGQLLPTPRANVVSDVNLNSKKLADRNKGNLEEILAVTVVGKGSEPACCPKTDGPDFRLSPLFTEEMMGFPLGWTLLPFLPANGSKKP